MFEPSDELTLTLLVPEVNIVLRLCRAHGIYDDVAPIIGKILQQAEAQQKPNAALPHPNVTTLTPDKATVRRPPRNDTATPPSA